MSVIDCFNDNCDFYHYLTTRSAGVLLHCCVDFLPFRDIHQHFAYKLLVAFGEVQLFSGDGEEEKANYSKLCRFKKQLQTIKDNYKREVHSCLPLHSLSFCVYSPRDLLEIVFCRRNCYWRITFELLFVSIN